MILEQSKRLVDLRAVELLPPVAERLPRILAAVANELERKVCCSSTGFARARVALLHVAEPAFEGDVRMLQLLDKLGSAEVTGERHGVALELGWLEAPSDLVDEYAQQLTDGG